MEYKNISSITRNGKCATIYSIIDNSSRVNVKSDKEEFSMKFNDLTIDCLEKIASYLGTR